MTSFPDELTNNTHTLVFLSTTLAPLRLRHAAGSVQTRAKRQTLLVIDEAAAAHAFSVREH